jgi:hypothetical protein
MITEASKLKRTFKNKNKKLMTKIGGKKLKNEETM